MKGAKMKGTEKTRLTRIVKKVARDCGVMAAIYADWSSFDILTERPVTEENIKAGTATGVYWIKRKARDAHISPGKLALSIRAEMREVWL